MSPARRIAHAERARLNLERFEREKRECQSDGDDGVTIRIRFDARKAAEFERAADEAFRREIARMEEGWDEP